MATKDIKFQLYPIVDPTVKEMLFPDGEDLYETQDLYTVFHKIESDLYESTLPPILKKVNYYYYPTRADKLSIFELVFQFLNRSLNPSLYLVGLKDLVEKSIFDGDEHPDFYSAHIQDDEIRLSYSIIGH